MKRKVKRFFNQEELKVCELKEAKDYTFNLKISETYGFEYYEELDRSINEFFNGIENSELPTTLKIVGDFDVLKSIDKRDFEEFAVAIVNIFSGYIVIPKTSTGNGRLGVPKAMDEMRIGTMTLRAMANRKIRFPKFRIEVLNLKGEIVFEVF